MDEEKARVIAEDVQTLHHLGYAQELARRLSWFSNFAVSLSVICILAGGVTSFSLGLCSVGGAAIGLGWPLVCLFSLAVAATMGQVASAFPTAGGLYHWSALLGGRGWGWTTAWFNLAGLVTVLAAINVGTIQFLVGALGGSLNNPSAWTASPWLQLGAVVAITLSQALVNHLGIRVTTLLTDFSGYWIILVAGVLTLVLLAEAPHLELKRLVSFTNYSGPEYGGVWPRTENLAWLFALGFLLPAYTITGFDASAHVSEETVGAARNVPRGILRSVLVSGLCGWVMLSAVVLAPAHLDEAAAQGNDAFCWIVDQALPGWLAVTLFAGIALAQYLCGLATVTSASRMAYAFARDGGLPCSGLLRRVSPRYRTPAAAIWMVAGAAVLFTVYTPVYSTITAVCTIFLYLSYVLPTALGLAAYGRSWTNMGPWDLGRWYRPLAVVSLLGCGCLLAIGMAPPNDRTFWILGCSLVLLGVLWLAVDRRRFPGPPPCSRPEGNPGAGRLS
ncbi:MAG: amino acid permease [Planctomycetes bacterium]|nr:amino acid permease [Planctomycetota bacterium]